MTEAYDVVVAGAGHNALVAAAYLAQAGLSCVVLEAADQPGGDTRSEELTLPGFVHDTCSTAHNLLQASPTLRNDELGLGRYGLEYLHPDPVVHVPFPDGAWITQWRDPQRTTAELARFSHRDADAYRDLLAEYDLVAPAYGRYRYTPAGWGPPLEELLLGQGARWVRRAAMSAWENIQERFEEDHVRAFMLWMAFMTVQPVDRPGGGLLAYSLVAGRQRQSWVLPRGGSGALSTALCRLIEANGGTIVTGQRVVGLSLRGGRCAGVETHTGARYTGRRGVVSTIHVKDLVEMAPADAWGEDFLYGVETWRAGHAMFVAHYATTEAPAFPVPGGAVTPVAAGTPGSVERMLGLEPELRAGRPATRDPVLLVLCPTVADPGRAPRGRHTLKVVGFQPYALGGDPDAWDEAKAGVAEANLEHLRQVAPNLGEDVVLASAVESPRDLERRNAHNWHGSCHGGDMSPAQSGALRPVPGWASHRLPIPGLYQTGATTHPGGSVSAGPGRNAAMVLLHDLGVSLEEVVAGGRPLARASLAGGP